MTQINFFVEGRPITAPKGITLGEIANKNKDRFHYQILLATVDNDVTELSQPILEGDYIEFVTIENEDGFTAYQRTITFLFLYAMKKELGILTQIKIEHSLNRNLYGEVKDENNKSVAISEETLANVKEIMMDIIKQEIVIDKEYLSWREGIQKAKDLGQYDKVDLLTYRASTHTTFYKLDGYYDYAYGPMVLETSRLSPFDLHVEDTGFLIQFTSPINPKELAKREDLEKLKTIYHESSEWARILEADTVASLNKIICSGKMDDFIRINEALHEKKVAEVADTLKESKKHLVLIAGPSSSGKTTFANRLMTQLRVLGLNAYILSVDNYFNDSESVPLDEKGNPDFEELRHVNLELLNNDLQKLLSYEIVTLPFYDFGEGVRKPDGEIIQLKENDILIVEGIHALNDEMTYSIGKKDKFKIFISALTQLNIDSHVRISATDNRLLRRIVRDHKFRAYSAARTIDIWDSVKRGERKHIFPYQEGADVFFNSALLYELGILKLYAEPLLYAILPHEKEYGEARRLLRFLDSFMGISPEAVPNISILAEFIGGVALNEDEKEEFI